MKPHMTDPWWHACNVHFHYTSSAKFTYPGCISHLCPISVCRAETIWGQYFKDWQHPNTSFSFDGLMDLVARQQQNMSTTASVVVSRRRQNPLYESHGSDTSNPVKSTGMIGCQCPCFVTLLVALVAVAAFVMAILVITGTTKTHGK